MKLVLVDWLDSHQSRGWQDVERIEEAAEPLYCRSVGWLLAENPDCKVLVPHVSGERNGTVLLQGCGGYCQVDVERANLSRRADFLCSHRTAQVTSCQTMKARSRSSR